MKVRKLLIVLFVLSLWGGTMVFADAAAQRVNILVNGKEGVNSGVIIDGQTLLPLREIAGSLQALVAWDNDTKKVIVTKPNVHMFLFQDQKTFGNVDKNNRYTFNVFAQIDNLTTQISAVKVSIFNPANQETVIQSQDVNLKGKDNFWFRTENIKYHFETEGKYAVRFFMKASPTDEWGLVSEKIITAE
ncbi:copper amine oxidase [Paenibacillus sp. 32O-W]|uniref:stalk domain-containing protein n=1 Tax=Paenibacillus sp. 32O-W TaxID=1695218 RepID=UPI0007222E89|nr:stalk domain-containing protein [Paenibacillus sp. 32O-W]ALS27411.1 copper amine oxidase [Paenibacillus sp. 32O-W]